MIMGASKTKGFCSPYHLSTPRSDVQELGRSTFRSCIVISIIKKLKLRKGKKKIMSQD